MRNPGADLGANSVRLDGSGQAGSTLAGLGGEGTQLTRCCKFNPYNVALIAMKRAKLAQKAARVEETIPHRQLQYSLSQRQGKAVALGHSVAPLPHFGPLPIRGRVMDRLYPTYCFYHEALV